MRTSDSFDPSRTVVLVVDDDDFVRVLLRRILRSKGYVVLDASNGAEGLALCRAYPGIIDILVSDIVMPEVDGRQLAAGARQLRPELKVLFISGYSADMVLDDWDGNEVSFLQKPFSSRDLESKVRATLCARAAGA